MTTEFLLRLGQQRSRSGLVGFDELTVAGARLEDLDQRLCERFRSSRTADALPDFLVKLGMAARDDASDLRPTVAGLLLGTRNPRKWFPNAYVQAVAYAGTVAAPSRPDEVYQLDAKDADGPLDEQILAACRFVFRNQRVAARKNLGRTDLPQYDMQAVFEAVVNAIAHRDYSIHGAKVRLFVFEDRLELYSPGGLPNTLEIGSLPYRQVSRNQAVTSLLAGCALGSEGDFLGTDRRTFMEKRGEGVRIILDRSTALAGRAPEYRVLDDAEVLLTIWAARPGTAEE
jgi:predicted HTH transcriptional regulator